MSDNIIPFPGRRDEPDDNEPGTPAATPEADDGWTLVKIVPQAPKPSR